MIQRASRRDDRHPRRRARPDLPAPRERDRAEPLRARRRAARALLGAQRLRRHGRGEDVEEPRQRRHAGRAAGAGPSRRDAAAGLLSAHYRQPLRGPRTLVAQARRRSTGFIARPATPKPARSTRACSTRCATISTRRWRLSRLSALDDPATLKASAQAARPARQVIADDWFQGDGPMPTSDRSAAIAAARRGQGKTAISPPPTASATNSRPRASSWRTARAAPLGAGNERAALHDRNPAAGGVAPASRTRSIARTARAEASFADLRQPGRDDGSARRGRPGRSARRSRSTPAPSARPRRR